MAGATRLVYQPVGQPDYLQNNFDTLVNYILTEPGGSDLILSKPQGVNHLGQVVLTTKSSEFAALTEFVNAVTQGSGGSNQQALFDGVDMLNNEETLRKAALLFAGRLPTEGELTSVAGGGEADLRQAVRDLMAGNGFENFLIEGANDRLLTLAFSRAVFAVVDRYHYPNSRQYFRQRNMFGSDARYTSEALALEPLKTDFSCSDERAALYRGPNRGLRHGESLVGGGLRW